MLNYKDKAVAQIMHFNMLLLMTNKRIVKNLVATLLSKFIKNVDIYIYVHLAKVVFSINNTHLCRIIIRQNYRYSKPNRIDFFSTVFRN